jgi:hypothetical protein
MNSNSDQISRSDLALVLGAAAELQARRWEDDAIPLVEAERVAAEVGIEPAEFRSAVRALRASRLAGSRLLGPDSVLFAEAELDAAVDDVAAARMLTQAHASLPVTTSIESPAAGTWRSADRTTLLQVTSDRGRTSIAAAVNRRLTKLGLIGGGSWLGVVAGITVLPSLTIAAGGGVEAAMIAQAAGMLGGAGAGFWAGRSAWTQTARRTQSRVLAALERMRGVVEALEPRSVPGEGHGKLTGGVSPRAGNAAADAGEHPG